MTGSGFASSLKGDDLKERYFPIVTVPSIAGSGEQVF
jgi:hypothetical protein